MSVHVTTLIKRRKQLLEGMDVGSVAIVLSGNPIARTGDQFHEFVVWRNFYYLTNIDRSNFALLLYKGENETKEMLFIDQVSELEEKWSGIRLKKDEVARLSGIEEKSIFGMPDFERYFGSMMMYDTITAGYFDLERISYQHLDTEQMKFAKVISDKYPQLQIKNLYPTLATMRQVKSPCEIAHIKTAIDKTRIGIEAMMRASKPGLYEYEIEAYYDFNAKLGGVKEKAFHTIAASGANATVLHYDTNDAQTKDGDLILFDLGCAWHHYAADISRTFPVNGTFSPRQKAVYQGVLNAQKAVIESIKPGVTMSELNQLARQLLAAECRGLGLIGEDDDGVLNYYYHSIGHSLGLDTHDVGGRDYELQPGMVITIEPGLYIEEEGIGIRIEDDILVTDSGYENLSASIIKEIDEIESFMRK